MPDENPLSAHLRNTLHAQSETEIPLDGGNTSVVVRVGDTVRRSGGPWTAAAHDLLSHLEAAGFDGSPRAQGFDDQGREVLEFVPGEVGTLTPEAPLAPWFRTPDACWAIGRWIRDYQSALAGFVPDAAKPWRRAPGSAAGEVIVHHDVSPYNTVRRADGSLVVLDWDFARPGDSIDDLAWAAWMWVPLQTGTWWHAQQGTAPDDDVDQRQMANLAALIDGYGPSADQRTRLADAITHQMASHADDLEEMARTDPAFADLVDRDFATTARADAAWWPTSDVRRIVLP